MKHIVLIPGLILGYWVLEFMTFSIHSLVFIVSAFNGLLFVLIAFAKSRDDKHNLYLGTLLLLLTIMLFDEFGRWTPDFFNTYPQFTMVFTFAWFLFIPTIYLWIRYLTNKTRLKWIDILHIVPLVIFNINLNHFTISLKYRQIALGEHFNAPEGHVGKVIFSIQIIFYLIGLFKLLGEKYRYRGIELFRKLSVWLKSIVILLVLYFISIWIFILTYEIFGIYLIELDIWKTNLFLVFIYGWLFYALFNPDKLKVPVKSMRIWKEHYRFDNLSDELDIIIKEIRDKELFLNNDLGVPELANELGVPGRRLTDLVNSELNISIPILINILRIEVMEKSISKPEFKRLSLEGVAKSVGFKSKSSFYSFFKTFTGETPKNYFEKLG